MERTQTLDRWLYPGKAPEPAAGLLKRRLGQASAACIGPAQLVMLEAAGAAGQPYPGDGPHL